MHSKLGLARAFCAGDNSSPVQNRIAIQTAPDLKSALRNFSWRLKARTAGLSFLTVIAFLYEFYPVSVISSLLVLQSSAGSASHPLLRQLVLSLQVCADNPSQVQITTFKGKKIRASIESILPATEILPAYRSLQERTKSTNSNSASEQPNIVGFESDESGGFLRRFFAKKDLGRTKLIEDFVASIREDVLGCVGDVNQGTTLKYVDNPDRFFFYFRVAEQPFLISFHYADINAKFDIELLFRILNGNRPLKLRKEVDLSKLVSPDEAEYFLLGGKKKTELGVEIPKQAIEQKQEGPHPRV